MLGFGHGQVCASQGLTCSRGDVKLAGLLGLALGWWGWTALFTGTFLGWLLAAVVRVALRTTGRVERDDPMPLGPFLAMGAVATVVLSATSS